MLQLLSETNQELVSLLATLFLLSFKPPRLIVLSNFLFVCVYLKHFLVWNGPSSMTEQNVKQVLSWTVEKFLYYHEELQERYISEK